MTGNDKGSLPLSGSTLAYAADNALSFLVVGPLTVFFWRGMWEFLNRHLVPDDPELGAWICCIVGNVGIVLLAVTQNLWHSHVTAETTCSGRWFVGYHLYTYVLGVLNIFHWRGMWNLLDFYTGISPSSAWITLAVGQGVLWLFRCTKCILAPPLIVEFDKNPEFFIHTGRFYTKFRLSVTKILDSIFTVAFIHQMTVFYWRGSWELFDLYMFPDDPHASAVFTLLISFALHALLCLLQPVLNRLFRQTFKTRRPKEWQWLLETLACLIGNPVCVTHWRGVWNLLNAYVTPEYADVIDLSTHFLGIGLLMLMMCGHSVTTRGCPIDGDVTAEEGCMFPNKYLRYWLEKKENALENKQEKLLSEDKQDQQQQQQQQLSDVKAFDHNHNQPLQPASVPRDAKTASPVVKGPVSPASPVSHVSPVRSRKQETEVMKITVV